MSACLSNGESGAGREGRREGMSGERERKGC